MVEIEIIFAINFILDVGQRPVIKSVTGHQVWTESLGVMVSKGKVKRCSHKGVMIRKQIQPFPLHDVQARNQFIIVI